MVKVQIGSTPSGTAISSTHNSKLIQSLSKAAESKLFTRRVGLYFGSFVVRIDDQASLLMWRQQINARYVDDRLTIDWLIVGLAVSGTT